MDERTICRTILQYLAGGPELRDPTEMTIPARRNTTAHRQSRRRVAMVLDGVLRDSRSKSHRFLNKIFLMPAPDQTLAVKGGMRRIGCRPCYPSQPFT